MPVCIMGLLLLLLFYSMLIYYWDLAIHIISILGYTIHITIDILLGSTIVVYHWDIAILVGLFDKNDLLDVFVPSGLAP